MLKLTSTTSRSFFSIHSVTADNFTSLCPNFGLATNSSLGLSVNPNLQATHRDDSDIYRGGENVLVANKAHTLSPTHPHTHSLSLSHTLTQTHPHTLSLTHTHTHSHTHTHTHSLSHTHTYHMVSVVGGGILTASIPSSLLTTTVRTSG